MSTKFLTFPFDIKTAEESESQGIIEGYASTFGNMDLGLDIVDKGAFSKTIQETKGKFPVLADHDPRKQIGWNVMAKEDKDGLLVKGELDVAVNQLAKERFSMAKKGLALGATVGLSIGYMTIKSEPDRDRPAVRRLKELKLLEYSMVPFAMNQEAMITSSKAWGNEVQIDTEILAFIKQLIDNGKTKGEILKTLERAVHLEKEPDLELVHSVRELARVFSS